MLEENYVIVTEEDLLRKVSDTENNYIERKTTSDTRGWLETAVAFANSCPVGQPGILYVNVDNSGEVILQPPDYDFEKLQKSISKRIGEAWPPIYVVTHILNSNGHEFVAVVVYGSPNRPHFAGHAFVRLGPENKDASGEQYDLLVAQRNRKLRALRSLLGQTVHWHSTNYMTGSETGEVTECNEFYLTVNSTNDLRSFPIDWITLSYDPRNQRYKIIITAPL